MCQSGESKTCPDCEDWNETFVCKDCVVWLQSRLAGAIGGDSVKVCKAQDAYKLDFFGMNIFKLHQDTICPVIFGIPTAIVIIILLYIFLKGRSNPRGYKGYVREMPRRVYRAVPEYASRGYRYVRRRD
jgi:hypothetical protein